MTISSTWFSLAPSTSAQYPDSLRLDLKLSPTQFELFRAVMKRQGVRLRTQYPSGEPWPSKKQFAYTLFCYALQPLGWTFDQVGDTVSTALNELVDIQQEPAPSITYEQWRLAIEQMEIAFLSNHPPTPDQLQQALQRVSDSLTRQEFDEAEGVLDELELRGVPASDLVRYRIRIHDALGRSADVVSSYETSREALRGGASTLALIAKAYLSLAEEAIGIAGDVTAVASHQRGPVQQQLQGAKQVLDLLGVRLATGSQPHLRSTAARLSGRLHQLSGDLPGAIGELVQAMICTSDSPDEPDAVEIRDALENAVQAWSKTGQPERETVLQSLQLLPESERPATQNWSEAAASLMVAPEPLEQPPVAREEAPRVAPGGTTVPYPTLEEIRDLARTGRHAEIVELGRCHLAPSSDLNGEYFLLAGLAAHQQSAPEARLWLESAVTAGWSSFELFKALGDLYSSSDPARTLHYYEQALSDDPNDEQTLSAMLNLLIEQNEPERVVVACQKVIDTCDTMRKAWARRDLYEWRLYYLGELVSTDSERFLEDYRRAALELLDLLLSHKPAHVDSALKVIQDATATLKDNPDELVAIASALETVDDGRCRNEVITVYSNIAAVLLPQAPFGGMALLQVVARRLFFLNREYFRVLAAEFDRRVAEAAHHAQLLGAPSEATGSLVDAASNLAGERIVIVGAEASVRGRAIVHLKRQGAQYIHEIPPTWDGGAHLHQADINRLVDNATLVVEVHRCIKHSTTGMVDTAVRHRDIPRVFARGTGHTSILEAVLDFVRTRQRTIA